MLDKNRTLIGLTGPIASGKDEAVKILKRQGAIVIDVDKLAHTLYAVHSLVWQKIVTTFGSKVLNRGGAVNRRKLGAVVFSDRSKLQQLNKIIHPVLKEAVINWIKEQGLGPSTVLGARNKGLILINAAVLKEIGLIEVVDQVWVVMASKDARLKRLMKKDMNKVDALKRINSQLPQKEYLEMADVVIKNDSTLKELKNRIKQELDRLDAAV